MALKKCKECGNEVSTKAASCPKCGAVLKKKIGYLRYIGAAFLIFIILRVIGSLLNNETNRPTSRSSSSSLSSESKSKPEQRIYKEGETIRVGYTTYTVFRSSWPSLRISDRRLGQRPNAMYLFVDMVIRNDDKKARMIPSFKLVDENSAEYEANSNTGGDSIGILERLNPSVSKYGFVVFDVPKGHKYRLKLSDEYWSAEDTYIQLSPQDER